MKSQVNALLHVLQALVLKDFVSAYPELRDDFSKDFERIALSVKDRGLTVFTLDLPHLESLLLRGLEEGRLSLEGPFSERVSKRIQVPRLFAGLWLRIFDIDSSLKLEPDVTALAFLRQALVLGKKLEVECSPERTKASVGAYHDIEHRLRRPDLNWSGDDLGVWVAEGRADYRPFFGVVSPRQLNLFGSPETDQEETKQEKENTLTDLGRNLETLHLVQALRYQPGVGETSLPLFETHFPDYSQEDHDLLTKIQQVADILVDSWEPLNPIAFSCYLEQRGKGIGFKHGPGAVAERLKNWEKSQFPNWPLKLQATFPYEYCGVTASAMFGSRPINHEVAARLIAVPKTAKGPRLIAAEPTSHQWCQQLVLKFMFDQCRKSFGTAFIDFHDQTKSGDLVLKASLDRELATVDLSDASDRLTCWTVERMFRRNPSLLLALHAARTRYLRDEISERATGRRDFLALRKFASQGTATTFPVMSCVMLFIALGCSLGDEEVNAHNIWKLRSQVRVFGDDIILPAHGYERLLRAMALLQLKVNAAKSYVHGRFRESCGTDGYAGYDITPCKPKTVVGDNPAACQAVIDNSNNLYMKGFWHASTAFSDLLPVLLRRRLRIVGPHALGQRGLASYSGSDESHLEKRWNSRFHRWDVRVWTLSIRTQKRQRDGLSALLDFFASKHSNEQARSVSEYADVRKTIAGLRREPSGSHALVPYGHRDLQSRHDPFYRTVDRELRRLRTGSSNAGDTRSRLGRTCGAK